MNRLIRLALLAVPAAALACAALIGLPDVPEPTDAGGPDADATADGPATDAAPACALSSPPPRPDADDPSTDGEQSFVVAMHALDFGARPDGGASPSYAYDLDHVFTCCQGAPESCTPLTGTTHCDGDGGVDNSGGQLLESLAQVAPEFAQDAINQRVLDGVYTVLFYVSHYNGTPDDTSVTLGVFASRGIESADGGVGDGATPPRWDGTDVWSLDSDFVLNPDAAPPVPGRFDSRAYVSSGVLVASIDFPLLLGPTSGNTVIASIHAGSVIGRITDAGAGKFRLTDVRLVGRWATRDILGEFPSIFVFGAFVCPSTPTYAQLKALVCKAADLSAFPSGDGTGAPCNALSFGIGLSTDPARLGRVVAAPTRPKNCGDPPPDECDAQ